MGIFWELLQEDKLQKQKDRAESLEERVESLEIELTRTQELLSKTLIALESHIDQDIDGDGKTGQPVLVVNSVSFFINSILLRLKRSFSAS